MPKTVQTRLAELNDADVKVRRRAARKLAAYGDSSVIEPLCHALQDEDAYVRSAAAGSLGALRDGRAFEPLCEALKDKRVGLRRAAAHSLAHISLSHPELMEQTVRHLVQAARKDNSRERWRYSEALSALGIAGVAAMCREYCSYRSEASQTCLQQALCFLEFHQRLDVAHCLLAAPDLTAPQQWTGLEMLAQHRPTGWWTSRKLADPRRYCEQVAANPQDAENARRGARQVLEYLSLGRASQRSDTTAGQELLRGAQAGVSQDAPETLLRGTDVALLTEAGERERQQPEQRVWLQRVLIWFGYKPRR